MYILRSDMPYFAVMKAHQPQNMVSKFLMLVFVPMDKFCIW